jgi:hypothetical protein
MMLSGASGRGVSCSSRRPWTSGGQQPASRGKSPQRWFARPHKQGSRPYLQSVAKPFFADFCVEACEDWEEMDFWCCGTIGGDDKDTEIRDTLSCHRLQEHRSTYRKRIWSPTINDYYPQILRKIMVIGTIRDYFPRSFNQRSGQVTSLHGPATESRNRHRSNSRMLTNDLELALAAPPNKAVMPTFVTSSTFTTHSGSDSPVESRPEDTELARHYPSNRNISISISREPGAGSRHQTSRVSSCRQPSPLLEYWILN